MVETGARSTTVLIQFEDNDETHPSWGNALSSEEQEIILHLADSQAKIVLQLSERVILGRKAAKMNAALDVDLSPYQAAENGVSRIHATLYRVRHTTFLMDLSSANGTFLNGQRLFPYKERLVRDGDEIRLGSLRLHVYFGNGTNP